MKQRSDYTFKYNQDLGRHGWLRLTPAYSVKLVKEILCTDNLFTNPDNKDKHILDPFSGTATTGIVAAEMGLDCQLYDINPFLIWLAEVKCKNYRLSDLDFLVNTTIGDLASIKYPDNDLWIPDMKNIERWWSPDTLRSLSILHNYISVSWGRPNNKDCYNLLWIAFARQIIATSAANYGHVSVSFKNDTENFDFEYIKQRFINDLLDIVKSAKIQLSGSVTIDDMDARNINNNADRKFNTVITSPPYPNRISYIRELRPYMYWLGFLTSGEQAGELDWKAIGGTWGSATSRLSSWQPDENADLPHEVHDSCKQIEEADRKNGKTMSKYVQKFFNDMFLHLSTLPNVLDNNSEIYYILGNSFFYGIHVDTEAIITSILDTVGFKNVKSTPIRKRNCKKGLYEYCISAQWKAQT